VWSGTGWAACFDSTIQACEQLSALCPGPPALHAVTRRLARLPRRAPHRLTASWQALRDASTPQAVAAAGAGPSVDPSELAQPLQQLAIEAGAGAATRQCAHGSHAHGHGAGGACPDAAARGSDQGTANGGPAKLAAAANGGSCGHGHGHGHGAARSGSGSGSLEAAAAGGAYGPDGIAAPLASEVAAATAEAARGLDAAIEEINAALEEVREAAAELQE
jgi:hypothetical protein